MIDPKNPTFAELDRDGAIEEAAAKAGVTRSRFLRMSAFAGGGLIVGGLPVAFSVAQGTSKNDVAILNYAETTDFLLAALREPLAVILSLVTVPVFKLVTGWGKYSRRKWKVFRKQQIKAEAAAWYPYYRSGIGQLGEGQRREIQRLAAGRGVLALRGRQQDQHGAPP